VLARQLFVVGPLPIYQQPLASKFGAPGLRQVGQVWLLAVQLSLPQVVDYDRRHVLGLAGSQ
jgi:hypothetical protein